jgi:hypothetical protein
VDLAKYCVDAVLVEGANADGQGPCLGPSCDPGGSATASPRTDGNLDGSLRRVTAMFGDRMSIDGDVLVDHSIMAEPLHGHVSNCLPVELTDSHDCRGR